MCDFNEMLRLEQTRWIPVTERLPEKDGRYIAYIKAPDNWVLHKELSYVSELQYDNCQKIWHLTEEINYNAVPGVVDCGEVVTHWMPLPEPPKEETE